MKKVNKSNKVKNLYLVVDSPIANFDLTQEEIDTTRRNLVTHHNYGQIIFKFVSVVFVLLCVTGLVLNFLTEQTNHTNASSPSKSINYHGIEDVINQTKMPMNLKPVKENSGSVNTIDFKKQFANEQEAIKYMQTAKVSNALAEQKYKNYRMKKLENGKYLVLYEK
ncbi:hypothetical protein ESZ50_02600 [Weissella muntiaci]|uniref:Uncharacterized protein n=1 Tax=Weissella muntiaci TaxID=2508881 RepID=A0A6C2CAV8_9LACO|nr:hypothetical protein [Weissella muntiaci]TYC50579.1 hypothetical protein ESZ50_02600 [Weissella muntiaci]